MDFFKRLFSSNEIGHDMIIEPGEIEEAVNYMAQPGKIDVSELSFYAVPYDEDPNGENDYHTDSVLDIAIFELPDGCGGHNCVLSEVGIGRMEEYRGSTFSNLCHDGRLFINGAIFRGYHLQLDIPSKGSMKKHLKGSKLPANYGGNYYEVIMANCNEDGRQVYVEGQVVFEFSVDDSSDQAISLPSLDTPDVKYLLVSISTFFFFFLCCFRVRCRANSTYEIAAQNEDA